MTTIKYYRKKKHLINNKNNGLDKYPKEKYFKVINIEIKKNDIIEEPIGFFAVLT